jgi:predicted nucleic acid-binding protein
MSDHWAKHHYLDASALVKVVIDEGDHELVRSFFRTNVNLGATSLCVVEALGVIKAKWTYDRISEDEYFKATRQLVQYASGKKLEVEDIGLFTFQGLDAVQAFAKKHSLDMSDALQLDTILRGKYAHLGPNSASTLITADAGLAAAAKSEGIRVWNCIKEPQPSWA